MKLLQVDMSFLSYLGCAFLLDCVPAEENEINSHLQHIGMLMTLWHSRYGGIVMGKDGNVLTRGVLAGKGCSGEHLCVKLNQRQPIAAPDLRERLYSS